PGRSAAYELTGLGIDPRNTREMWEESLEMIPNIWTNQYLDWEGKYWNVPSREALPKPFQQPHPPIWVAGLQPATYELAAQKGIGMLALGVVEPAQLAEHIAKYKRRGEGKAGRQVHQQPVAELDHGPVRRGRPGGARPVHDV